MPNTATVQEQRLRKTKAQLIDEIDSLEQRAAAIEAANRSGAPMRPAASDRYLADQDLHHLAKFPSENPNPVLRVIPNGTVLYANDAATAVKGLLKGRKKSTLARDLGEVCAEASRTAEVRETEFEIGDRVFAFSITPVTGETYINIYGRDVTDGHNTRLALEAANEASAAAEAWLRAIIDNSPATICLKDAKGRYLLVNKHFTELHGTTAEAMMGKTAHELFPKEIADPFRTHDRRVLRTGVAEEREQVVTTPGGLRTFSEIKFPITTNGEQSKVNAIGLIATDVTERKRAEAELTEKEAQLRLALDNMRGGIRLVDNDRNYVFFNQQYLDLYDFPEGLLKVGESNRVENLYMAKRGDLGPGDPVALTDQWRDAAPVQTEAVSWVRETILGKTLQVHTAPTPVGGFVNIVTDITELKRTERELREAKRRSEEASKHVTEKNRMLESLSTQLSKYLSPQVYASIFSGKQSVEIAAKRKKLTVFFSDIADFTGITDSLESEELTNFLNHYLTEMSKIALDHGATIDKYVGDAIIAFFGDPETRGVKEDAITCVNMAIAMQRRMRELQSEWLAMGLDRPFELRIGINTGFCTVGNFGSRDRMDYTIIGNEVNLAARLESHAEVGSTLIAHKTHSLVKDTIMAEEGDSLAVKGFATPVRTYSVIGHYDDLAQQGRIIHKERGSVRVLVDLQTGDKANAIQAIKDVLSQLED